MNGAGPTPSAISLRGVSKRYGTQLALAPTDLEIAEGEFFCLLGPSGCGKTTTLNLIGGFVAPTTGEILIRDARVDRLPPHRRPVNTVFQSYALFPHMTVRDNVAFGLKMARVPKQEAGGRIGEVLELVGLEHLADRQPGQLSGGQQQRVAVARALVNRPAVLLLDEPLGALDLKLRKRLQVELSQIHRDVGTTFVYVTHDQEEAMSMATRIAVMNEGRVEQIGVPSEIYHRPRSRFVADFIGESNFLEVELGGSANGVVRLRDGTPVPGRRGDVDPVAARGALMVRPESVRISTQPDGPPGGPGLKGRVLQTSFLGNQTRVAVACEAVDAPMLASLFGRDQVGRRDLRLDMEVTLWWEPDDAVLLPETNSEPEQEEGET
jgi:spermidine/putrescine transport system ATP-binding protein